MWKKGLKFAPKIHNMALNIKLPGSGRLYLTPKNSIDYREDVVNAPQFYMYHRFYRKFGRISGAGPGGPNAPETGLFGVPLRSILCASRKERSRSLLRFAHKMI
jgi:hypothetical protein